MLARQLCRSARAAQRSARTTRCYSVTPDSAKIAKFPGQKQSDGKYLVSLIEGDGIGPEISQSVKDIFSAADAPIVRCYLLSLTTLLTCTRAGSLWTSHLF